MTPADTFYLAAEFRRRFPDAPGLRAPPAGNCRHSPPAARRRSASIGWRAISARRIRFWRSSYSIEFLNVKSFASFMGFPSRLLAESWESNNLYWARLLDEKGLPPVMLNQLVPQLTLRMTQKIFATDIEDWPAVLRAMRETGEEFRQGRLPSPRTGRRARICRPTGKIECHRLPEQLTRVKAMPKRIDSSAL